MKVVIGQGSCGIATGAKKTQAEFEAQIAAKGVNAEIDFTNPASSAKIGRMITI